MNGFSVTNLRYIRQWYLFYSQCLSIHQQAVGELTMASIVQIPWGHNIVIISKCKSKDKLIAEYALSDINKPIGVSEYQLTQSLPEDLKSSLPSIEEIEKELAGKK